VAISRLAYLAARGRRHLVVVDAKGGADGLASDVVSAVLQGWPEARVGLFPQQPIDLWRGTPAAVVNRLIQVWDFSPEAAYYREIAVVALRLALGQPGPPCRSSAELVARLDPAAGLAGRHRDAEPDPLPQDRAARRPRPRVELGERAWRVVRWQLEP
jgi:hypothetical protein